MTDEKRLKNAIYSGKEEKIHEVFNQMYDKYKPLVVFVAAKYLKSTDDIDDVVQDTFISFFNKIKDIDSNIKAYLTVIVKNKAIDFIRKNKRIEYVDIEDLDYYNNDEYYKKISNESFIAYLDEIKRIVGEEDANIIIMYLVDGMSFSDIGIRLNMNMKSIKTRYYRALKKIQGGHLKQ